MLYAHEKTSALHVLPSLLVVSCTCLLFHLFRIGDEEKTRYVKSGVTFISACDEMAALEPLAAVHLLLYVLFRSALLPFEFFGKVSKKGQEYARSAIAYLLATIFMKPVRHLSENIFGASGNDNGEAGIINSCLHAVNNEDDIFDAGSEGVSRSGALSRRKRGQPDSVSRRDIPRRVTING